MLSRRSSKRRSAVLPVAAVLVIALCSRARPAAAIERTLILAVELNDWPLQTTVVATDQDGDLLIHREDWAAIGLEAPSGAPKDLVSLRSRAGVSYSIDEPRQVLLLHAGESALLHQLLGEARRLKQPDASAFGAALNYDTLVLRGNAQAFGSLTEARIDTPWGTLSQSVLFATPAKDWATRLATTFTHSDYEDGRTWRVGDVVTGGLPWTRPFHLVGVQTQTNFAMRPDLVTYPVPSLSGHVAVPSTVDLLVNGVRQFSTEIQPGAFTIRQPPMATGAGDISVVSSNALGQQIIKTVPFYSSAALLAEELKSFTIETGMAQTGYGRSDAAYPIPAASASFRIGARDWLTAETHAEVSGNLQTAGAGIVLNAFNLGIVSVAAAGSHTAPAGNTAAPGTGGFYSARIESHDTRISYALSFAAAAARFRDVPAMLGDPVPRRTVTASLGYSLALPGSLRLSWVSSRGGLLPIYAANRLPWLSVGNAEIGSVTYTRPVGERASFYASAYRDFGRAESAGAVFGISVPLGVTRSVGAFASVSAGAPSITVDATQNAVSAGDIGLRTRVSTDAGGTGQAEASYISQHATSALAVEQYGRQRNRRGELHGALVLAGGRLFATNRIQDSYAVVDTDGQPGVPVLLENRLVGETDASGHLLLPDLRGWDENRVSIDPRTLPADIETDQLNILIRPADHSGVVARFPISRGKSALIRLVDQAGVPIPAGTTAILRTTGKHLPIGFDGEVFASGVAPDDALLVATPAGTCNATFHFTPMPNDIPVIGPVVCIPVTHP